MKNTYALSLLSSFLLQVSVEATTLPRLPKASRPIVVAPTELESLHLDLEAQGSEYYRLLRSPQMAKTLALRSPFLPREPVEEAIAVGERNLRWQAALNSRRDAGHQLRLTSPNDRGGGIPITAPSSYSPSIVSQRLEALRGQVPELLLKVVLDGSLGMDTELGDLPVEKYIEFARKIDRLYQTAARWQTMAPYRDYFTRVAARDVRGYYFLTHDAGIVAKLRAFNEVAADEQAIIQGHMKKLCLNNGYDSGECANAWNSNLAAKHLDTYYASLLPEGKNNFDSFYNIEGARSDIRWTGADNGTAMIPVRRPDVTLIADYLKNNVEDEWKWTNGWKLQLNFSTSARVHVRFEAGVVPHVNGLGGDEIVMDANQSVDEYESQWTIRHEFGHVLGFPDCYIEFYDTATEAMVNYQIDTSDLMCSRAGNMNERLYREMARIYRR